MTLQYTPIAVMSLLTAGLAVVLAWAVWHRRTVPGRTAFAGLMLAAGEWALMRTLEAAAVEMTAKIFWAKLEYPGIVSVSVFWLIFVLRYTDFGSWLTRRRRHQLVLWIVPAITLALALTNEWHHLIWTTITPSPTRPTEILIYGHGTWFWVHAVYSYTLLLVGSLWLIRAAVRSYRVYRVQSAVILMATAMPWIGNAIYLTGLSPIPGLDLTPLSCVLTGLLLSWAIFRYRLFDLVPVARHTLIDNMADGVLVLDAQNRIVDVNPAAQHLIGAGPSGLIGQSASQALAPWPDVVARYCDQRDVQDELVIDSVQPARYLDLRISLLVDRHGRFTGRLVVLRDISERKRAEIELQQANERLRERLAEIQALQTRLREQAVCDPLTGLFNRRHFFTLAHQAFEHARQHERPLAAIMIDLDHFKDVNDTYGHAVGDQVLVAAGQRIQGNLRQTDVLCRYGGEEFAVLLPGTALDPAHQVALRIHESMVQAPIRAGEHDAVISASLGVAGLADDVVNLDQLLVHADLALYAAKRAGRSRVVAYDSPTGRRIHQETPPLEVG
ncbi:MAG: diguanylate cyclase [Chloroflexi bacterium]|nr:diguanylate cyclase [Chloroflexota bacterium]